MISTQTHLSMKIAVVIPCYKVKKHILDVLRQIGPEVSLIYVVDDCCPEGSGKFVKEQSTDDRVRVLFNKKNQGVGGAVVRGYKEALKDNADIVVKIDGDNQMDPALLMDIVAPILVGKADYTKGNRFYNLEHLVGMPKIRVFGNAALSLLTKLSSGYWNLFDPTNGYTAVHAVALQRLPLDKLDKRYFFETDMLFRLNTIRAVAMDIPMQAKYADEISNLKISRILTVFLRKHISNTFKRVFYNYYLRDMSIASFELLFGFPLFLFGALFGGSKWWMSATQGIEATAGTAVIASTSLLIGLQLMLGFLAYDTRAMPVNSLISKRYSLQHRGTGLMTPPEE